MFAKKLFDSPEMEAGDMTLLRELVHPSNDGLPIGYSLAHARLPIGEASLPHRLKSSELYYILQGFCTIYINDEQRNLRANEVAFVPAGAMQYVENTGIEELVFLCIVEPFWTPEDEAIG